MNVVLYHYKIHKQITGLQTPYKDLHRLNRGVIGNTADFGSAISGSSPDGSTINENVV